MRVDAPRERRPRCTPREKKQAFSSQPTRDEMKTRSGVSRLELNQRSSMSTAATQNTSVGKGKRRTVGHGVVLRACACAWLDLPRGGNNTLGVGRKKY